MSVITRYVLCDRNGIEGDVEYEDFRKAREDAQQADCAVLERTYVYDDTELVWTPDGANTWNTWTRDTYDPRT